MKDLRGVLIGALAGGLLVGLGAFLSRSPTPSVSPEAIVACREAKVQAEMAWLMVSVYRLPEPERSSAERHADDARAAALNSPEALRSTTEYARRWMEIASDHESTTPAQRREVMGAAIAASDSAWEACKALDI